MRRKWTKADLENLIGETESLVLEFKHEDSLRPTGGKDDQVRFAEASKDVAAMANETGGTIIYGIDEHEVDGVRKAVRVGQGFASADRMNRERFLQLMATRILPPIVGLDAQDVDLGGSCRVLVVDVPMARAHAYQTTEDFLFWRRDAQGLRKMTAQQIEDVCGRLERPELELRIKAPAGLLKPDGDFETPAVFEVVNTSQATASFAVITLALLPNTQVTSTVLNAWRYLPSDSYWTIMRAAIASGSSPGWSPITPGFNVSPEPAHFHIRRVVVEGSWRTVGLARLDHDGGSRCYCIEFGPHVGLALRLSEFPGDANWGDMKLPEMFLGAS